MTAQRRGDPRVGGDDYVGLLGVDQRAEMGASGTVEHSQRDPTPQPAAHADEIREGIRSRAVRELPACDALEENPYRICGCPETVVHTHPHIGRHAKQFVAQTLCGGVVTATNASGKDQHPSARPGATDAGRGRSLDGYGAPCRMSGWTFTKTAGRTVVSKASFYTAWARRSMRVLLRGDGSAAKVARASPGVR